MKNLEENKTEYAKFLEDIKSKIQISRIIASKSVNKELIKLYWNIGKEITKRQEKFGWGKSVVEILSKDLQTEFENIEGFSARNLWDMRRFYVEYKDDIILRQLVAEIPWGHNLLIMNKIKDKNEREYYIRATIEMSWSRNVLNLQIESNAYERQKTIKKQHNAGLKKIKKLRPFHLHTQDYPLYLPNFY